MALSKRLSKTWRMRLASKKLPEALEAAKKAIARDPKAAEPSMLTLELFSMGVAEAERMVALLLALKPHHAMLLVEHDMDAVFTLADRLSVMVNGVVIASGTPQEIRHDATVQAAYLGEEHA